MQSASKMPEEYTCLIDAVILWPVLSKPCTELRKIPGQHISLARGGELLKIVEISLKTHTRGRRIECQCGPRHCFRLVTT